MTERKELDEYTFQDLDNYCFGSGTTYYVKHEAVRVMDGLEARIKELEAAKPKWIYVNDRLPEFGQSVLVIDYSPDNNDGCFIAWRNKTSYGWEWHLTEGITADWTFFTHWMPLPPPPTEENTATEKEDA